MTPDPLIGAEPTPVPELSQQDVVAMHKRWKETNLKAVHAALKKAGLDPENNSRRATALNKALFMARRNRIKLNKKQLGELAAKTPRQIMREANRDWPDPLSDRSKARFKGFTRRRNWWGTRNSAYYKDRYDQEIFNGRDRIYIPLQKPAGQSETEIAVRRRLTELGMTEIDYADGLCKDDRGNTRKIGRTLSNDPELLKAFGNDATRNWKKQMVVISRDPYDIARMSTGRGWKSCMKQGHPFYRFAQLDAQIGTLVTYLISKDDPHILDPQSRVLLKPHENSDGERILVPGVLYGLPNELHEDTIRNWVDNGYNFGKSGRFNRSMLLYGDRQPRRRVRLPENTEGARLEQVFDILKVKYDKQPGGGYRVKGDLDLSGMALSKLPNLSNVVVEGNFDCSGNVLTSLEGSPQSVSGSYVCSGNRLRSLTGISGYIGLHLTADDNRLENLQGAPQTIRGSLSVVRNRLRTLTGAPTTIGESFHADNNRLSSLNAGPQDVARNYSVRFNSLSSLEGAPQLVKGDFDVSDNRLPTLAGSPQVVDGNFIAAGNHLTDLEGGPEQVGSVVTVTRNPLTSYYGLPRVFRRLSADRGQYRGRDRVPAFMTEQNRAGDSLKDGPKDNTPPAAEDKKWSGLDADKPGPDKADRRRPIGPRFAG
ncbi:MAG: hypothetical protein Alpg2KO_15120 [Alphaproteobacteria bacterium]